MDPHTGRIYELGADLTDGAAIGDRMDLDILRDRVADLGARASEAERRAATEARELVRVAPEAAQVARLGERERERRRRRRKAERQGRRANR